jgi:hypothetical protein
MLRFEVAISPDSHAICDYIIVHFDGQKCWGTRVSL